MDRLNEYVDIFAGTKLSDCPLPCTKTKYRTALLDEKFVNSNHSKVDITFANSVSVVKTDFPVFNLAKFLSALGGCMGIWLGLGILQGIEILMNIKCELK